jgi:2-oxoglutarate dehydrogenase E1 component
MRRLSKSFTRITSNDPTSVPAEWRDYFDRLAQMPGLSPATLPHAPVVSAFAELAKDGGFRPGGTGGRWRQQEAICGRPAGHRLPLARHALGRPRSAQALPRPKIDELEPSFYGFTDADLNQTFSVGSLKGCRRTPSSAISWKP